MLCPNSFEHLFNSRTRPISLSNSGKAKIFLFRYPLMNISPFWTNKVEKAIFWIANLILSPLKWTIWDNLFCKFPLSFLKTSINPGSCRASDRLINLVNWDSKLSLIILINLSSPYSSIYPSIFFMKSKILSALSIILWSWTWIWCIFLASFFCSDLFNRKNSS